MKRLMKFLIIVKLFLNSFACFADEGLLYYFDASLVVFEDVRKSITDKKFKEAQKQLEDLALILKDDKQKKNEYIYTNILRFHIQSKQGTTDSAFEVLLEMNMEKLIGFRLSRLKNITSFYEENFYKLNDKNLEYDLKLISSWEHHHFKEFIHREIEALLPSIQPNLEFNSYEKLLLPEDKELNVRTRPLEIASYLIADILLDRKLWSVKQELGFNDITLKKNMALVQKNDNKLIPYQKNIHPYDKAILVLKNLEVHLWSLDLLSSLIEARVELVKLIFHDSRQSKVKEKLTAQLEVFLRDLSIDEWWSKGVYELSEMLLILNENSPNHKILEKLKECSKTYPESFGGKKCRDRLLILAKPSLKINVDKIINFSQDRLNITSENIENIHFKLLRFNELKLREGLDQPKRNIQIADILPILKKDISPFKKITVKNYKEYTKIESLVTLDESKTGNYILFITQSDDLAFEDNVMDFFFVHNSQYSPYMLEAEDNVEFMLIDKANGDRIENFSLSSKTFKNKKIKKNLDKTQSKKTLAGTDILLFNTKNEVLPLFYSSKNDADTVIQNNIQSILIMDQDSLEREEKLHYKIFAEASLKNKKLQLSVVAPNGDISLSQDIRLDSKAQAIGSFRLRRNAPLGLYKVKINDVIKFEFNHFEKKISPTNSAIKVEKSKLDVGPQSVLKIRVDKIGFSGNVEFKFSNEEAASSKKLDNTGKVLIYSLVDDSDDLAQRNTKELLKFYDVNSKNDTVKLKNLAPGSYRLKYTLSQTGDSVQEKEIDFSTYYDGKHNNFLFESMVNTNKARVGEDLLIYTGTNIQNRYTHVEALKEGKILKRFKSITPKISKLKILKEWKGEITIRTYMVAENKLHLKSFLVKIP